MKRIYANIKLESTAHPDGEECAIKAEYCKCWLGQNSTPPRTSEESQTWLSPRQNRYVYISTSSICLSHLTKFLLSFMYDILYCMYTYSTTYYV